MLGTDTYEKFFVFATATIFFTFWFAVNQYQPKLPEIKKIEDRIELNLPKLEIQIQQQQRKEVNWNGPLA